MKRWCFVLICAWLAVQGCATAADDSPEAKGESFQSLSDAVKNIKRQAIGLDREFMMLEEDLVPPGDQFVMFMSLQQQAGLAFEGMQVKVYVDGTLVGQRQYSAALMQALNAGGYARVYFGGMPPGRHELVAEVLKPDKGEKQKKTRAGLMVDKDWRRKLLIMDVKLSDREPEIGFQ